MGYSDPSYRARGRVLGGPQAEAEPRTSPKLPEPAQRTLDEIADALNVTAAVLHRGAVPPPMGWDGQASLVEASALLRAFIQIDDPETRKRCLAFVEAEAAGSTDKAPRDGTRRRAATPARSGRRGN
ncbi:hypothetical protein [Methylobacterium sp. ID0610]|uniref:hypothetical protein n=1 Tax=Methylobacterium carpenticola TaxID=3344827 RepID=UPI00368E7615